MAQELGTDIPVGERIKFFREASRRTKVSVAARADISVDYLYMIEKGLKVPSTRVLYKLATILGVPVSALFSQPDLVNGPLVHPAGPAVASAMMDFGRGEADQRVDLTRASRSLALSLEHLPAVPQVSFRSRYTSGSARRRRWA
jgi:transcriptional regulator with XRE-family HTH domain